jgi:hypothetical protein
MDKQIDERIYLWIYRRMKCCRDEQGYRGTDKQTYTIHIRARHINKQTDRCTNEWTVRRTVRWTVG